MNRALLIVILIITIFAGYMLGYSIPPFIQSGAFSDREEKGVAVEIDKKTEGYYDDLFKEEEE
jgi:hypothetical protein